MPVFMKQACVLPLPEKGPDTAGWVHDKEIQKSLGNGFSPKKRPGTGAVISWEEGQVLSDSNPAHVISGGIVVRDGTAEVRGENQCTE